MSHFRSASETKRAAEQDPSPDPTMHIDATAFVDTIKRQSPAQVP